MRPDHRQKISEIMNQGDDRLRTNLILWRGFVIEPNFNWHALLLRRDCCMTVIWLLKTDAKSTAQSTLVFIAQVEAVESGAALLIWYANHCYQASKSGTAYMHAIASHFPDSCIRNPITHVSVVLDEARRKLGSGSGAKHLNNTVLNEMLVRYQIFFWRPRIHSKSIGCGSFARIAQCRQHFSPKPKAAALAGPDCELLWNERGIYYLTVTVRPRGAISQKQNLNKQSNTCFMMMIASGQMRVLVVNVNNAPSTVSVRLRWSGLLAKSNQRLSGLFSLYMSRCTPALLHISRAWCLTTSPSEANSNTAGLILKGVFAGRSSTTTSSSKL